eukprot:TRINITY_DN51262_c0_g1_i1.p1 TRINITY_DN51262_c0_g1~~TRINITY_DN51262_c0_g1_i1.p1  ORF type:complete len:131 (-),score=35.57 TRINITY_DN51262_c0_g1_i1:77-469(-)
MSEAKAEYKPTSVQAVWDHHFAAFGGHNVPEIIIDYTEESVVNMYNHTDGTLNTYKGITQIEACFTSLFQSLTDMSGTAAPVQSVDEKHKTLFLIWQVTGSGYTKCTDTFVLNNDYKIIAQNVVVSYTKP